MNFIAYYRVSTKRQGKSGLGLESQRKSVTSYIEREGGTLVGEYTDVESGGNDNRANLREAIKEATLTGSTIVVKKLDRLSRGGFRIATELDDLGIGYIDCDSPTDSPFIKDIKLSIAKEEKGKISGRISSALSVIKEGIEKKGFHISSSGNKITSLGNKHNLGGAKAIANSVAVRKRKALNDPNNLRAAAVIKLMIGSNSYTAIAGYLNDNGFKTSRGNDFSDVQVRNIHLRNN